MWLIRTWPRCEAQHLRPCKDNDHTMALQKWGVVGRGLRVCAVALWTCPDSRWSLGIRKAVPGSREDPQPVQEMAGVLPRHTKSPGRGGGGGAGQRPERGAGQSKQCPEVQARGPDSPESSGMPPHGPSRGVTVDVTFIQATGHTQHDMDKVCKAAAWRQGGQWRGC